MFLLFKGNFYLFSIIKNNLEAFWISITSSSHKEDLFYPIITGRIISQTSFITTLSSFCFCSSAFMLKLSLLSLINGFLCQKEFLFRSTMCTTVLSSVWLHLLELCSRNSPPFLVAKIIPLVSLEESLQTSPKLETG